jgi:hypothetical protein
VHLASARIAESLNLGKLINLLRKVDGFGFPKYADETTLGVLATELTKRLKPIGLPKRLTRAKRGANQLDEMMYLHGLLKLMGVTRFSFFELRVADGDGLLPSGSGDVAQMWFDYNHKLNDDFTWWFPYNPSGGDDILIFAAQAERSIRFTKTQLKDNGMPSDDATLRLYEHEGYILKIRDDEYVTLVNTEGYKGERLRIDTKTGRFDWKGHRYQIDSVMLSGDGHAFSGITCDDQRYVYNGHPALPKLLAQACPLMPFDWLNHGPHGFTINSMCNVKNIKHERERRDRTLSSTLYGNKNIYIAVKLGDAR